MNTFTIFSNSQKITNRLLQLGFYPKNSKLNTFEISTREKPRDFCQAIFVGMDICHDVDYYIINFTW